MRQLHKDFYKKGLGLAVPTTQTLVMDKDVKGNIEERKTKYIAKKQTSQKGGHSYPGRNRRANTGTGTGTGNCKRPATKFATARRAATASNNITTPDYNNSAYLRGSTRNGRSKSTGCAGMAKKSRRSAERQWQQPRGHSSNNARARTRVKTVSAASRG